MRALCQAGFTLIELLIVVTIIGLLAAAFLPDLLAGQVAAYVSADQANMRQHYAWFTDYERKLKHKPMHGGHKFLLELWTSGVVNNTEENFDRFFTPGLRNNDAHYMQLRQRVMVKEKIWPSIEDTTSLDTHYAGRAKEHIISVSKADEVWTANDNEFSPSFDDGTVNYMVSGGNVRSLSFQQLRETYNWQHEAPDNPVFKTWGPDADLEMFTKLDK